MTVHIVWHESSLAHDPGPQHPESPARLEAVLATLRATPRLTWHDAIEADDAMLSRVHTPDYLAMLAGVALRGGGRLDPDTVANESSYTAARFAAGAAVHAARLALCGNNSFAAVRPPGHHATATDATGFCLLNSVVVAARTALEESGVARVLIIDWDVHHGNGTQSLVERDERIRYVSLHQWPHYPGTGRAEERGVGNVFNVPRPPGLPRHKYVDDLNAAVELAVIDWRPDLVLVSAGFDGLAGDPLGGFTLEPEDFASWIETWRQIGPPIASVLEGGYAPPRVALAAAAHVRALG